MFQHACVQPSTVQSHLQGISHCLSVVLEFNVISFLESEFKVMNDLGIEKRS
jgi:hypothetical protein